MKRRAVVAVAWLIGLPCAAFAALALGAITTLAFLDLIGPLK